MAGVAYRPIDPFSPAPDGRYQDVAVTVVRERAGAPDGPGELIVRTGPFALSRDGNRLVLVHAIPGSQLDNDVAAQIVRDLFEPGWVSGADTFERLMTGVVLTSRPDPLEAWDLFYRNTLRRLGEPGPAVGESGEPESGTRAGHGCVSDIAPVYRRALARVQQAGARSVLDLGSCFGFFPLQLGRAGIPEVFASDISPGTCRLVERISARIGPALRVLGCDALAVPLGSRSVDVVTSLHLLEHVEEQHGDAILAEAVRLARHRVVVAVPMELVPDPAYGHIRVLTPELLAAAAQRVAPGWRTTVEEHHGAWLVLDRAPTTLR